MSKDPADVATPVVKGSNRLFWFVLVMALGLLLLGGSFLYQGLVKRPSPAVGPVSVVSREPTTRTPTSAPTESPAGTSHEEDAALNDLAHRFVSTIKSGKKGEEWAREMRASVSSGFYESLKHADSLSVPAGAKDVTVTGGNGVWTATAIDESNQSLYSFKIVGFRNIQGTTTFLVDSMDIPQKDEPTYDDQGHVIPTPDAPLDTAVQVSMYAQSTRVIQSYLEVAPGETKEQREARVRKAVDSGEFPPLRNTDVASTVALGINEPTEVHIMEAVTGEPVKEGFVTVSLTASCFDLAAPGVIVETLLMGVDLKWDEGTKAWQPAGLRILPNR